MNQRFGLYSDFRRHVRDHPKSLCAQQKEGCDQDPTVGKGGWQLDPALLVVVWLSLPPASFASAFPHGHIFSCPSYLAFYNIYVLCHVNS